MVDVAKVKLFGMDMGTFRWDESYNVARFEYDKNFAAAESEIDLKKRADYFKKCQEKNFADKGLEPSPIMMPVQQGRIYSFGNLNRDTFNGLPGMLADSLPDTYGRALFDRWLTLTGRTSGNPVEMLCFLGHRCMGALEYEPATGPASDENMKFEIDSL